MSIQAMAWAIEQQEVKDPETQLVLMCLANCAGADGSNAFPAIQRLMRDSRLSERSVRRHLRKLEAMSLIRRGNQAVAAAYIARADRRPIVYDLVIPRGVSDAPRSSTGGQREPNGGSQATSRGVCVAPDPILKSEREPKRLSTEEVEKEIALRFGRTVTGLVHQKKGPKH